VAEELAFGRIREGTVVGQLVDLADVVKEYAGH
jgi:hypothetical protein